MFYFEISKPTRVASVDVHLLGTLGRKVVVCCQC